MVLQGEMENLQAFGLIFYHFYRHNLLMLYGQIGAVLATVSVVLVVLE